jgi:glycosyltransferase involved in cell wall biosynthesis
VTRFSLIVATVGRTEQLGRFLASLHAQRRRDFELVVVDQNNDARVRSVLAPYEDRFPVIHVRTLKRGASRARNIGLQRVSGELVAFPDDDCIYPADLLANVDSIFDRRPMLDGVAVCSVDEGGRISNGRLDTQSGPVTRSNVWARAIEYTMFLRARSIVGLRFDEGLGPGAGTPLGAGEGTDYLLKLLARGASLHYDADLAVVHASAVPPYDGRAMARAYSYGAGMGYVLKRHESPVWCKVNRLVRPLGGALLSLMGLRTLEAQYRWSTFRGRLRGMLS